LNTTTITARDNTTTLAIDAAIAVAADDLFSAVFNPLPTYASGDSVTLTVGTGALDFLGNPLPSTTAITWPSIQGAPAANARVPDAITQASVTGPTAGTVTATQTFTLTLPRPNACARAARTR
jgi:hypothetical protein